MNYYHLIICRVISELQHGTQTHFQPSLTASPLFLSLSFSLMQDCRSMPKFYLTPIKISTFTHGFDYTSMSIHET